MKLPGKLNKRQTDDKHTPQVSLDESKYDGLAEQSRNKDTYGAATILSGIAIGGTLLGMGWFFLGDIPGKIVSANQAVLSETVEADERDDNPYDYDIAVEDEDDNDNDASGERSVTIEQGDQYIMATLPGLIGSISQEELMTYINDMSDKEYDKFISSVSALLQSDDPEKALSELDPEIKVYLTGEANASDDTSSDKTESKVKDGTVVDAYEAAEAIFGDAIDGSKRIKLIEELNAVDYQYYVAEDGDTLLELSKTFDVGLGQLVELNGIHDADELPAGHIIILPSDVEVDDNNKVIEK